MNYLITGGTGFLSGAIIKRLLNNELVNKIVVFSRDDHKQEKMKREIKDNRMRYWIGDVRDKERVERALKNIDVVIHTAALKHVDRGETDFDEYMNTNYEGAKNVIDGAGKNKVKKVVAISTDKACEPITGYGHSKAASDKAFIHANGSYPKTLFSLVRYGNVAGSSGSVIPTFRDYVKRKTLPLTDERMTRFWITLDEAVDLIFYALRNMQGSEIYVAKMPSFRVVDLIEAFGCTSYPIGIREAEKIHEVVCTELDHVYDDGHCYIIYPFQRPRRIEKKGTLLENFRYSSDHNEFLTVEQIKERLKNV